MGIFSRISDIVNANVISMLDKAEDPEKMVRLMIQEMEDTLVEVKSEAVKFIAESKTINREIIRLEGEAQEWRKKAELAVDSDREDLAIAALEEKSKKESIAGKLKSELEVVGEAVSKFKEDIQLLQKKLEETRSRQQSIVIRKKSAQARKGIHDQVNRVNSAGVMEKFERFEQGLDRLEGELEVSQPQPADLQSEFDKLERKSAIEKELIEIKANQKKKV